MIEWLFRRALSRGGPSRDHDPRLLAFARGAAIGALVGAAFAGSSMWRRSGRQRQHADEQSAGAGRFAGLELLPNPATHPPGI